MRTIVVLPLVAYLALPGLLAAVVVVAKVSRSARERASTKRRSRVRTLLESGRPESALREVNAASRRARDDFAFVFAASRSLTGAYRSAVSAVVGATPVRSAIARDLRSRSPIRRAKTALAAARLGVPEAAAAAALLLADRDPEVRTTALRALGMIHRPEAAWLLLRALASGAAAPERAAERLAAPWAVEPLCAAYDQPEFVHVRRWIITALDLAGSAAAEPYALRLLAESDPEDRVHACRVLGGTRSAAAVEPLLGALSDVEWTVRAQAARALGAIGDDGAAVALAAGLSDASWWVRNNCAQALRSIGASGEAALQEALSATDRYARDRAVEALALGRLDRQRGLIAAVDG